MPGLGQVRLKYAIIYIKFIIVVWHILALEFQSPNNLLLLLVLSPMGGNSNFSTHLLKYRILLYIFLSLHTSFYIIT